MNGKKIGERLRKIRVELGFSQVELGEAVGVTDSTVQNWESGSIPPGKKLLILGEKFGISSDWMLFGRGSMFMPVDAVADTPGEYRSRMSHPGETGIRVARVLAGLGVPAERWQEGFAELAKAFGED